MPPTTRPLKLEVTKPWQAALEIMEAGDRHLLLTGKAGTGKSTLLRHFRETTKRPVAVVAPTGVAALTIEGQTIHSFFGFRPDVTTDTVKAPRGDSPVRKIRTLVIDEISMVRADLFDCVDKALRMAGPKPTQPFGGIQLILIGDLYQIPPVVTSQEREMFRERYATPYFFSATAFDGLDIEFIELEKVYRQKDHAFIALLNAIRNHTVTDEQLAVLNERVDPAFEPPAGDLYVTLTPTNAAADEENSRRLERLDGKLATYSSDQTGEFIRSALPAPEMLELKKGAQVMMTSNDGQGQWVNGTLGRILETKAKDDEGNTVLHVEFTDGEQAEVRQNTWEMFRYTWDKKARKLDTEITGTYTQFPVRLAWAVTIHKSQGKTLDRVILDLGRGVFTGGQTYVALSRCTSLEGLTLKRPIRRQDIFVDRRIVRFVVGFQYAKAELRSPVVEKTRIIKSAIESKQALTIVYLKASDERSTRTVTPQTVGEMTHSGRTFLAMAGWCHSRKETRVFRLDRILDLAPAR